MTRAFKLILRAALAAILTIAMGLGANTAQAVETLQPEDSFWRPPAYLGITALGVGALGLVVGARWVDKNGDWVGDTNSFHSRGSLGVLLLGGGVASAVLGAAMIDWARLSPEQRLGGRVKRRQWSFAAVGAGALVAGAGAALVMRGNNLTRNDERDNPTLGAYRLLGWPAIVLGGAAALVGVEGLTIDLIRGPRTGDVAATQFGIGWQGRF